jgi:hypothetical protein
MVIHAYNPRTWETEARGSRVGGLPELHKGTLSEKNQTSTKKLEKDHPWLVFGTSVRLRKRRDWTLYFSLTHFLEKIII